MFDRLHSPGANQMEKGATHISAEIHRTCRSCIPKFILEILDSASSGVLVFDERCRIVYINHHAIQMVGKAAQSALGKPATFFIDDKGFMEWLGRGTQDHMEPFIWQNRSLLISASRIKEAGQVLGYLVVLQRVDSYQQMDERANRLQKEFSSLLENSYDGIILADSERLLNVNPSFGRITGIAPKTLVGKRIADLDTGKHICLAAIYEIIRLVCHHKKTLTLQRKLISGNEIFLTGNPISDRHNQVARILVNVRDVTELKSLENQIKRMSALCKETGVPLGAKAEAFQGIVVESPAMRRLLDLVLRVSRVDSTVLLQGESGVGKDVFARLIHRLSERRERPFLSVNCGAIPEALLESEFFGYEKGAFTSADRNGKTGLFETANGGILFLDEVGELPLNLQVKLLKVLQDRRCRRVGGVGDIALDLRILAASNRDLSQMVAEGRFRSDLFYRLHVVPIDIPPLRERREDILPLALLFLTHFNSKYHVSRTLGHELMSVLESYDWPGNVRELQNLVERLVVTADTDVLAVRHLPESISGSIERKRPFSTPGGTLDLKVGREMVEREMIQRALAQAGTTRRAAKLLGVDHSTVVRKAKRYGIHACADADSA